MCVSTNEKHVQIRFLFCDIIIETLNKQTKCKV